MYLAKGAIVSVDLGEWHIIGESTVDNLEKELKESIMYFLKKYITKENLGFIDCTPYDEVFFSKGEELKNRVKRINLSESSLHITLEIKFEEENSIYCLVNEYDYKGLKFAEKICEAFEKYSYRNKGVKRAEVYNLLYTNNPSIIVEFALKKEEIDNIEKASFISRIIVDAIKSLGTK